MSNADIYIAPKQKKNKMSADSNEHYSKLNAIKSLL